MRVVITGASGKVGSALTCRLQAAGEYDIVAVARRTPDHAAMNGLRWVSIDLSSGDCGPVLRQVFLTSWRRARRCVGDAPGLALRYAPELLAYSDTDQSGTPCTRGLHRLDVGRQPLEP